MTNEHVRQVACLAALATFTATATGSDPVFKVQPASAETTSITVEHSRRDPEDIRIQSDVIQRLSRMENVEGLVGVESLEKVVHLSGRVYTNSQASRVEREARSVDGVIDVQNRIRARIGPTR